MSRLIRYLLIICAVSAVIASAACAEGEMPDTLLMLTGGSAVLADDDGNLIVEAGVYSGIAPLTGSSYYAARRIEGGGLGVIDSRGREMTDFIYDSLEYADGRIIYARDGLTGVMTVSGDPLIEARYTRLIVTDKGYLALKSNPLDDTPDALWQISLDGTERATGIRLSFGPLASSTGLYEAADTRGLWGYLNGVGSWAIEAAFAWCGPFASGRAVAATAEGAGLIDPRGNWVVPPAYRRVIKRDNRALGFTDGGIQLISCRDGSVLAEFTGENVDGGFTGGRVWIACSGRCALYDEDGRLLYAAPDGVSRLNALGDTVILTYASFPEAPMSFVGADGEERGAWNELSYAGLYEGRAYLIFSLYETSVAEYGSATFYDEIPGSRRYGLMDENGAVIGDDFIALKRSGQSLLTAETENWIGLIRPDGQIIARLEKSE